MSSVETKHEQLLHYALVKAHEHQSNGRQKVWAVITDKRNHIITEAGNNYRRSHPLQKHFMTKAGRYLQEQCHAEIKALSLLQSMRLRVKGAKLFVARSSPSMESRLAKPCVICQEAINTLGKELGINQVFYTESN